MSGELEDLAVRVTSLGTGDQLRRRELELSCGTAEMLVFMISRHGPSLRGVAEEPNKP